MGHLVHNYEYLKKGNMILLFLVPTDFNEVANVIFQVIETKKSFDLDNLSINFIKGIAKSIIDPSLGLIKK